MVSLRDVKQNDIERLAFLANDKRISDNLRDYFPSPYTLQDAEFFVGLVDKQSPKENRAIYLNETLVGIGGAHPLTDIYRHTAEVGYWIGVEYWGQGIMTQAIPLIIQHGFDVLKMERLEAGVLSGNPGSMRILEKGGFEYEGVSKNRILKNDQYIDEHRYAILRNSYLSR